MNIIGIDPGDNGAVVCLFGSKQNIEIMPLSNIGMDVFDFLCNCKKDDYYWAYIESVHTMPDQGIVSAGKFMESFGYIKGLLTASKIPWELVSPQKWKKELGCIAPKGSTKTQKKNIDKALAQRLFPEIKITHTIADALLIAEYGRRMRKPF
jgi:crossover junction endodeoxyribonuclease RuvC